MTKPLLRLAATAALASLAAVFADPASAAACFIGRDHRGAPAEIRLFVERVGRFAEIHGVIVSPNIRPMRIKADYGSGAGRAFRGHEYESGAVFVIFHGLSPQGFVLEADGFGRFPFHAARC